jgi:hypothetical protein
VRGAARGAAHADPLGSLLAHCGLQRAGASKPVVGITLPAGYSFNLDGAAGYLTMGSVFLGIDLGARAALRGDLPFTAAPEGDHTPEHPSRLVRSLRCGPAPSRVGEGRGSSRTWRR